MTLSRSLPQCEFPAGYDGSVILERLAQVHDPELDEPVLQLGFVRALQVRDGHVRVELQLPTSWCAINFAYLMAQDIRVALLGVRGIREVSVGLSDHCAAGEIEAAVNSGKSFAEAFPGQGSQGLEALRRIFLRKGFLSRQERLLRELREAGYPPAAVCAMRVGDLSSEPRTMQRYLARRAELGLGSSPADPLIVDADGEPVPAERLEAHYRNVRTVRVAIEANGSFCRAVLAARHVSATAGETDVQP